MRHPEPDHGAGSAAKALGIARDKVKLNDMLMGGGFGRRGHRDEEFIVDAVLMSKDAGARSR